MLTYTVLLFTSCGISLFVSWGLCTQRLPASAFVLAIIALNLLFAVSVALVSARRDRAGT